MNRLRILRLAGAGLGALLLSGAVVAITASAAGVTVNPFAATSPSPNPSAKPGDAKRQQWCTAFSGHFASNLGKTPQQVSDAALKAFNQTVDDAVKAGQLTQQQGADMKAKAAKGTLCSGAFLAGPHGDGGPGGPGGPGAKAMGGVELGAAEAAVLGMSPADLKTSLQSGKTIKDLAAAKGLDEAAFRAAVVAQIKTGLDAKVKAGTLTQAQEDAMLQRLQTAPIPGWNGAMGHGPRGPQPAPSGTPAT